ncbi:MAG: hypothetical protein R3B93_02865 [Bacteroidia bacterium]
MNPELTGHYPGGGNQMVDIRTGEMVYFPNITMDDKDGIGKWSEEEFIAAQSGDRSRMAQR